MSTHAHTALRSSFLLSAAVLGSTASASAQSFLTYWSETAWKVEEGERFTGPTSNLRIEPRPGSTLTSLEALLPPAAGGGLPASVGLEFERLSLWGPNLPTGAGFDVTAKGALGGVQDQALSTIHVERLPNGDARYSFDFSPLGATTVTVQLWDGPTLVDTHAGLPIGGGGLDPWFIPNCPDPSGWCCTSGAFIWSPPFGWICVFPCIGVAEPWWTSGSTTSFNRIVISPDVPQLPPVVVSSLTVATRDLPGVEVRSLLLSGYGAIGTSYCTANPNSTGQTGVITGLGSTATAENRLDLHAFQLPNHAFGYFIVSPSQAFVPNAGGGQGNLCVGLNTGRFRSQLGNTGSTGALTVHVDLTAMPQPNGSVAVQGGQTWNFQCWHRDANPATTSNFTSGYSIVFQ